MSENFPEISLPKEEQDTLPSTPQLPLKDRARKIFTPRVKKTAKIGGGITMAAGVLRAFHWLFLGEGGKGIWGGKGYSVDGKDDNNSPEGSNPFDLEVIVNTLKNAYIEGGMEGQKLQIPAISEASHIDNLSAQTLATEAGGPGWILPLTSGGELPETASLIAEKLADQLTGTSQTEILQNYKLWHDNSVAFLEFLGQHGASQAFVNFNRCVIDVAKNDPTPETWQDRTPAVEACRMQAEPAPGKPLGNPSLIPLEQQEQGHTMGIATRIIEEGVHAEGVMIQALVKPALEIAQGMVVNHQLPAADDVQGWLNSSIVAGDKLIDYFKELPSNIREAIESRINHQVDTARPVTTDYVFETPTEAINNLIGGGGLPMAIILGIELGLAAINAGLYIKRSAEMRNIKLPSQEEIKQEAIKEELKYEKELQRGIPDGYIQAGLLISPGLFGIGGKVIEQTTGRLSEEVLAEVIMNAEDIRLETESYKKLIGLLRLGVGEETIRQIDSRNLLIRGEQLSTPIIKAEDLLGINFEVISKGQNKGRVCRGEPNWYD